MDSVPPYPLWTRSIFLSVRTCIFLTFIPFLSTYLYNIELTGHNLPDAKGNRYCINLVSIAGNVVVRKLRPYRLE
jgi:hypothetical protein